MRLNFGFVLLALVLMGSSGSCGGTTGVDALTEPESALEPGFELRVPDYGDDQLQELRRGIEGAVGVQASEAGQCRAMPIGAKPCGGPWAYFVYAVPTTDEDVLKELVAAYDARQALLNRRDGHMSTCDMVMPPTVGLDEGICIAGSSSHSIGTPEVQ